ncbi:hypothetical protein CH373_13575 [Leptospira perolatii]|uniref:Uncharacterized protein n=1 Tax=Leptospira perolatii TaxID=2023191 RepID=A0A2M9ZK54_9LEPT|nr:hypothetical protein CH360_11140 [Leptospira perolatii]PJZ72446.1 hypothetical protein CH373_13575 [Leptospira perolatii]
MNSALKGSPGFLRTDRSLPAICLGIILFAVILSTFHSHNRNSPNSNDVNRIEKQASVISETAAGCFLCRWKNSETKGPGHTSEVEILCYLKTDRILAINQKIRTSGILDSIRDRGPPSIVISFSHIIA